MIGLTELVRRQDDVLLNDGSPGGTVTNSRTDWIFGFKKNLRTWISLVNLEEHTRSKSEGGGMWKSAQGVAWQDAEALDRKVGSV